MKNQELARLLYKMLQNIVEASDAPSAEPVPTQSARVQAIHQLLYKVFMDVTTQERIPFTTFFSRIAYAFQKYSIPTRRQWYIHAFRKAATKLNGASEQNISDTFRLGIRALTDAIQIFYQIEPPDDIKKIIPTNAELAAYQPQEVSLRRPLIKVVLMADDPTTEQFSGVETETGEPVRIQYNIAERNDNFRKSVAVIRHIFTFPTTVNLLDVDITEGVLRPRGFVIEPDYLVDVTAIAECFRKEGAEPLLYLLHKFLPYEVSPSIMKGNIANFFLDELVANPAISFNDVFPKAFKINPLAFCIFEERAVREIFETTKGHFIHLKRVLSEDFPKAGINVKDCYLEPSFYAPKYGLQGRLDLFYQQPKTNKSAIVELKSGKPFKPNVYGISNNHFTQTLLYELLIDAAFKGRLDPTTYILYSVLERDNLKFAPAIKAQQYEALNIRNQILALEWAMMSLSEKPFDPNDNLFKRLTDRLSLVATGFEKRDVDLFEKTYSSLSDLEKKYFNAFAAFISREHQIAKIGKEGIEGLNGVASLWLSSAIEKDDNFAIFSHLRIVENRSTEADAFLVLEKTAKTNPLANFRVGDIVVLYPASNEPTPHSTGMLVTDNQIFKCTLIELGKTTITLRLRSRQLNQHIFTTTTFWNVEHDFLDSSYVGMYRGLFEFARQPKQKRAVVLEAPSPPQPPFGGAGGDLGVALEEQSHILQKIIHSKDYFLLWGPPGTGKTSVMLKHLVRYFWTETNENILLLAYTNRAVDEICESIDALGNDIRKAYIRIGSRFSTAATFHEQLLESKIEGVTTRKALREVLKSHRIYVATVASMTGKLELLDLIPFNRVIVDEASQILEPQLVGLLTRFDHFTLIGDHKQLPAVVQQSEDESATTDKDLHGIGLKNLRNSLFERLFKRCLTEGWTWAFDVLSHQGRMHTDIMYFPSTYFYDNKLKILPDGLNAFQLKALDFPLSKSNDLLKLITSQRVLFLNTPVDNTSNFNKTNAHEAVMVSRLVKAFSGLNPPLSIGVITPYRAQIAQIRKVLHEVDFDADTITIDTVERYQGGARDVILISLCTNESSQLGSLVSLSEEGVDRKLNVAVTRARQHLVILGNADILRGSAIYSRFIELYQPAVQIAP